MGASVNLLPYSVYKQLGLGELKPTTITLSLADRLVKIPKGTVEDVLVQVDKFYYPVDFIVLDIKPVAVGANYVLIILGRPFFGYLKCNHKLLKWGNAAYIWEYDIGTQYLSPRQKACAPRGRGSRRGISD